MNSAIVGVCHDKRQRSILDVTFPSWRSYGQRHGLPVIIIEHSCAGADFYWSKHRLFQQPELKSFRHILFLDNDVFIGPNAAPLAEQWDSPLIGATYECAQADWSHDFIEKYYDDYFVERPRSVPDLKIINTGVLVIPREQAEFLESVYEQWKDRMKRLAAPSEHPYDPFALAADQPHVSYALQAHSRFRDFGERFNTLWWHWYRKNVSKRQMPFLVRSKAAAISRGFLPGFLWRTAFRNERAIFSRARSTSDFLHVAGSKSSLFLES
jgi:hypothetical protein